jgi:hypothetical protein
MLLLASDIFEYENWLVEKKYIFFTHSLICLHSSCISLKYRIFTQIYSLRLFLSSHLSSTLAELKSTPNVTVLAVYPNMCIWLNKKKIMKTRKDETTITISRVTSEFVQKMKVLKTWKKERCKCYINKFKWNLNISIMMLLYCHNWKITATKQVW